MPDPSPIGYTVSGSRPSWPARPDASGRPNVVVVLCDDMGFSDIGCYGSEIPTPELDALAAAGIRHRNFHTAPICTPTRASLLTGMNPHRAGFGRVASFDPGFAGYSMEFPDGAPTIASAFRAAGYSTFAVGKWHLTREIEQSAAGSRHGWPLQKGFDRFYGFLDGFTNFFHPHQLVSDNHHLTIDEYPEGYYLTDDLTDRAVDMIRQSKAADPAKPFFLYLAHGAVHAPLQAPAADISPFAGAYDQGWEALRAARFARQRELGLFGEDTVLPDGHGDAEFPRWEELGPGQRKLAARHMEVYAAMVASVDRSVGTLRRALEQIGAWDDTIVVFLSDNGASSDLGPIGTTRYMLAHGTPVPPNEEVELANTDLVGGPRVFPHYPQGWAMACNTPFRLYKRNTHAGGHTVPCIVHWPNGDLPGGDIRDGYAHVVDLFPTLLEMAGLDAVTPADSRPDRIDGISFATTLRDGSAPATRTEQIFEAHGNRGLYSDGWEIVAEHGPLQPYSEDEWELYRVSGDATEMLDLAQAEPERLAALSRRWHRLAAEGHVFPLEDGSGVFFHQRPAFHRPEDPATFWPGLPTIERIRARDLVWNRSFTIEVHVEGATRDDAGVLVAHGDQATGYVLFVEDGTLSFSVNAGGVMTTIEGGPFDSDEVVVDIHCPAVDRWDVRLLVGGEERARRERMWMRTGLMTPLHGIDIGICRGSPVSWSLFERHGAFRWSGTIDRVVYRPGPYAADAPQLRVEEFRALGLSVPGGDRALHDD